MELLERESRHEEILLAGRNLQDTAWAQTAAQEVALGQHSRDMEDMAWARAAAQEADAYSRGGPGTGSPAYEPGTIWRARGEGGAPPGPAHAMGNAGRPISSVPRLR